MFQSNSDIYATFVFPVLSYLLLEVGETLGELGDAVNVYPPISFSDNEFDDLL